MWMRTKHRPPPPRGSGVEIEMLMSKKPKIDHDFDGDKDKLTITIHRYSLKRRTTREAIIQELKADFQGARKKQKKRRPSDNLKPFDAALLICSARLARYKSRHDKRRHNVPMSHWRCTIQAGAGRGAAA